jgi:hypothetical protein
LSVETNCPVAARPGSTEWALPFTAATYLPSTNTASVKTVVPLGIVAGVGHAAGAAEVAQAVILDPDRVHPPVAVEDPQLGVGPPLGAASSASLRVTPAAIPRATRRNCWCSRRAIARYAPETAV